MTVAEPRLTLERRLLREHAILIACDEVGRGALAGPVAVGAVVIDAPRSRKRVPQGLRDSKLVPEHRARRSGRPRGVVGVGECRRVGQFGRDR